MPHPDDLKIEIFADGADLQGIREAAASPYIKGFTTNPTLMRNAGVRDYMDFARDALSYVAGKPISFEVFARDPAEMQKQAMKLAELGPNVYVKVPIVAINGQLLTGLIGALSRAGVKINVTAVMTVSSVRHAVTMLEPKVPAIISVFAGRIADTGRNPIPQMKLSLDIVRQRPLAKLLWASPREVLNIYEADGIGCDIITVTKDLLAKLELCGKDLQQFETETAQMFDRDAQKAGYTIPTS